VAVIFLVGPSSLLAQPPAEKEEIQPAGQAEPRPIYRTDAVIQLDGVMDEPVWQRAEELPVDHVFGPVGQMDPKERMTVRMAWDGYHLYLGYAFYDDNLEAIGEDTLQGPVGNKRQGASIHVPWFTRVRAKHMPIKPDVAEFFLGFEGLNHFWELHHNAANQFNDVLCVDMDPSATAEGTIAGAHPYAIMPRPFLKDQREHRLGMAVRLLPKADGNPSTINDASDEDAGYTAELRIPWIGLMPPRDSRTTIELPPRKEGGKPIQAVGPWDLAGRTMRILLVYQNRDLEQVYRHSSPSKPGGWFHAGVQEHYPRFVLIDAEGPAEGEDEAE
jgi:hypothetical protein